jgi:hypothetical protein
MTPDFHPAIIPAIIFIILYIVCSVRINVLDDEEQADT